MNASLPDVSSIIRSSLAFWTASWKKSWRAPFFLDDGARGDDRLGVVVDRLGVEPVVEEAVVVVGPGLGVAAVESPEVQLVLDWQQENNTYIACYNNTRHMIHNLIQIYQKIITYSTQLSLTNLAVQHISWNALDYDIITSPDECFQVKRESSWCSSCEQHYPSVCTFESLNHAFNKINSP